MKHQENFNYPIDVVCAIINIDGKIMATQRSERMKFPLKWEFPGGKIENGETEVECLKREITEELNISIQVGERLSPVLYIAEDTSIRLIPYLANFVFGKITLAEHAQYLLLDKSDLLDLDWVEPDWVIARSL